MRRKNRISINSTKAILLLGAAWPALTASVGAQTVTAEGASESDVVVVTGRRVSTADLAVGVDEASNTVSVTREALLSAPSGVSGLKALEGLPGFNVQTDGALGLYEFGNSVTVRAFTFEQIGFTLDGIPMGRPDAFGGSPIFRYVDNENLQQVRASPGTMDVTVPTATSLGPSAEYFTIDPSEEFSATASMTFGDDELRRSFFRVGTGDINGFRAYVSRSKTDSNLWRGPGTIDREHVEGKAIYNFDDDTYIQANVVYNDFFDYDSPSMSRSTYESVGRFNSYLGTVPDLGVGPDVVFQDSGYTRYYIDRINVREDLVLGLTVGSDITDKLSTKVTGYWENKDGFGVSPDSYSNTLRNYEEQIAAGVPAAFNAPLVSPRGVQYGLSTVGGDRYGVTMASTYETANHSIEFGAWYEGETYNRQQLRLNKEGGNPAGAVLDEVAYYRRDYRSERDFVQFYLKDTVALFDDRLIVEAGFKSLFLDYRLVGFRDFDDYSRSVGGVAVLGFGPQEIKAEFDDAFQPAVGLVYNLSDTEQIFASYSQAMSLPREADALYDNVNTPRVGAERSTNYELGIRTNRPEFNAAIALYYVDFQDRIEVAGVPVAGQAGAIESVAVNVGEVESYGVEFTGNWKPSFLGDYVYFTGNFTYNVAEFQNDFAAGSGSPLGLIGNSLPDAPKWLATAGVTMEPASWIVANVSGRYTGNRFADFVNNNPMEDFTVFDAYIDIGDGVEGVGPLENVKLRANVTNFTDVDTLSFTFTTVAGTPFYRPLAPRTFQFSITGEF